MDCSWAGSKLLTSPVESSRLPAELLIVIEKGSNTEFLDALALAALNPKYTKTVFTLYEPIFTDLCGRWLSQAEVSVSSLDIVSALARILPWAPQLAVFVEELVLKRRAGVFEHLSSPKGMHLQDLPYQTLHDLFLAVFRLLLFDNHTFAPAIAPLQLQFMLRHENRSIRYLTIRILCLYLHAADAAMLRMVDQYLGDEVIEGEWEGQKIDYGFLSLWEEKRMEELESELRTLRQGRLEALTRSVPGRILRFNDFTTFTVEIAGVLMPRLHPSPTKASFLALTSTTCKNLASLSRALLKPNPVLVTGVAGSGKTALILDVARKLNAATSMITLHLNEQTDAKLLVGMYTTDSKPGSFAWRPGVLTQAVREGRWVLVEDLDRAPTEVLSVLLPLIEHGELLIPNRGERVHAARGFKLIATMRTVFNAQGTESLPRLNMLGMRLWRQVSLLLPGKDEISLIIGQSYPLLHAYLPTIMKVYSRLLAVYSEASTVGRNQALLGKGFNHRDIFKWCQRILQVLTAAGLRTGDEPFSEDLVDSIFMEAVDCFARGLRPGFGQAAVISCVAQELHMSPQRVQYCLYRRIPKYLNDQTDLRIGRVTLRKKQLPKAALTQRKRRSKDPFALTSHALRLLEQVAVAVGAAEPVLLVGETGTGKTTAVQQLANELGNKLIVVNLSQQSESGDLLGGFKPVSVRTLALPMKEEFDDLFESTFSRAKNKQYIEMMGRRVAKGQWSRVAILWREALRMVENAFGPLTESVVRSFPQHAGQVKKRRKLDSTMRESLKARWVTFASNLEQLSLQISGGSKSFVFSFIEGNIVKAAKNGDWVLLDEINLASSHTLESIADLLESGPDSPPSILLSEAGIAERFHAHPSFRIFGAMNPATDIGKKDLPLGLRSKFTELYVEAPDKDLADLLDVVKAYLGNFSVTDERAANDISRLYLEAKRLAEDNQLVDGADQKPHFSLRTLTRTLSYVTDIAPIYGLRRALYEGFSMSFLTLLSKESERLLIPLIDKYILGSHRNGRSLLQQTPRLPSNDHEYVQFKHYWIRRGPLPTLDQPHYIITPFVERNLLNLVRATSTRRFPVLVQGPTSSGKTSMIQYLAHISGNKYVRINNHEHTDLQEYIGTYVSGHDGQLQFQEGILIRALREGHWIVLDELNLAPTDVLEALNRLLDDNRELLIPETQEVVRPHPDFMLFATQNPAGLYGGRKVLSRAFRNRFLELHFDEIPDDELEIILRERTQIAPSFCARIVAVYKKLSLLRQTSRLFEQRNSFATLRDLFRWAQRRADTREELAANGFILLAERVRKPEERSVVKSVIEGIMKVTLHEEGLYGPPHVSESGNSATSAVSNGIVWTKAMCRLYTLVSKALENNEPVLLVGETGCGKTSICQVMAEVLGKHLYTVNAHQNTETGDLIGAQRPIRNRTAIEMQLRTDLASLLAAQPSNADPMEDDLEEMLQAYDSLATSMSERHGPEVIHRVGINRMKYKALFEWSDGSLVQAMKMGQLFLLDEISLADDSVLERLNSVLEPERSLLLAEKGPEESLVKASQGFQFIATMNPGGDYGKRELSPALRNRFTEIWVPSSSDPHDILQIVQVKIPSRFTSFSKGIVQFAQWFGAEYQSSATATISIRDILTWLDFISTWQANDPYLVLLHGAAMVYIDTLGANPTALLAISPDRVQRERESCLQKLSDLLDHDLASLYAEMPQVLGDEHSLSIGSFSIARAQTAVDKLNFSLRASTTQTNASRVLRALQLKKPILLEGDAGVGKTTLVVSIAQLVGKRLTRINLSEQTDLMDLFGSDVPVEGAEAGHFAWREAPFLRAMQNGEWVLLDEMNLASQSVLEGLNSCFDHRGEIYISELDQTFTRHPEFLVFAAQNPHHQGGGRKGLPASFVNRFTVVYADLLTSDDMMLICSHSFPDISTDTIQGMIRFVTALKSEITYNRGFGNSGSPWEINLRDMLRWLHLLSSQELLIASPVDFLDLLFTQRFRTPEDQDRLRSLFEAQSGQRVLERNYYNNLSASFFQIGHSFITRDLLLQPTPSPNIPISKTHLPILESVMVCIQRNWPCILVGPSGCGKSVLLKHLAAYAGAELVEFAVNSDIDTMDLVGGYEQVDPLQHVSAFLRRLQDHIHSQVLQAILAGQLSVQAVSMLDYLQRSNAGKIDLERICNYLGDLSEGQSTTGVSMLQKQCDELLRLPAVAEKARFEWVDGILIGALEQGKWLVLDNANLCSASVLDRLNSLLEPEGALLINEHPTTDGSARLVKPHPNFRVFLTMDPRYGELSRPMRNRCVEIFVPSLEHTSLTDTTGVRQGFTSESSIARLRNLRVIDLNVSSFALTSRLTDVCLDHISLSDLKILPRLKDHGSAAIFSKSQSTQSIISSGLDRYLKLCAPQSWSNHGILLFCKAVAQAAGLGHDFEYAQPIHPLVNPESVLIAAKALPNPNPYWLATLQEFTLDVAGLLQQLTHARQESDSKKLSQLTRLERSFALTRVQSFSRDSTAGVAYFLEMLGQAFLDWTQRDLQPVTAQPDNVPFLTDLLLYWKDLYDLVQSPVFEESEFQAYLTTGQELSSRALGDEGVSGFLQQKLGSGLSQFHASWQLSTGLSMERLWEACRPQTPPTLSQLSVYLRMEELADRFDNALWRSWIPVAQVNSVRASIAEALSVMQSQHTQSEELIETISKAIAELELRQGTENTKDIPYYQDVFEGLSQHYDLVDSMADHGNSAPRTPNHLLHLFAGRATKLDSSSHSRSLIPAFLSGLRDYPGSSGNTDWMALRGMTLITALGKINQAENVKLRLLEPLQTEIKVLGSSIALGTTTLALDQLKLLNRRLCKLLSMVFKAHQSYLDEDFLQQLMHTLDLALQSTNKSSISTSHFEDLRSAQVFKSDLPEKHYFRSITADFLLPSLFKLLKVIDHEGSSYSESASAWLHFSMGCLLLYIPDRPFDPATKPIVDMHRHTKRKSELQSKLEASRRFEKYFTGQNTSLRIGLLEQRLLALGDAPPVPAIARPLVSNLTQLQGEFNNLLKSVFNSCKSSDQLLRFIEGGHEVYAEIEMLKANISQVMSRLESGFRVHDDLTAPAVGLLKCFDVGLSLAILKTSKSDDVTNDSIASIADHTPFMGGAPNGFLHFNVDELTGRPEARLTYLDYLTVAQGIDHSTLSSPDRRQPLFSVLHSLYQDWKEQLGADKEKEAARTGLYRYRGAEDVAMEEDEENFEEMFPTYEEQGEESNSPRTDSKIAPRKLASLVAQKHAAIFVRIESGSAPLEALLVEAGATIGGMTNSMENKRAPVSAEVLLGPLLISLDQTEASLRESTEKRPKYNFYEDMNLVEAKKLLSLVQAIKSRFRQLIEAWPEHATLHEVVRICDELLNFQYGEPVAKFLTKAETLHGFIYEWQLVASREFSAADIYDALTRLLIEWRRLELSTWARLFDLEDEKCMEDARSWWFIAYEVIIAVPVSLAESHDLRKHAESVLELLENFFSTTTIGQYSQRLRILESFRGLTGLIAKDMPSIVSVHMSLVNFYSFFKRFEKPIEEALRKGRHQLEKDMKEILLLASWKDTNINALRDSAKRSHHKLFKLVRKYRALLGQPAENSIKQGLPREDGEHVDIQTEDQSFQISAMDPQAMAICETHLEDWSMTPLRLRNSSSTVENMARLARILDSPVDASLHLKSFISDLAESMSTLRRQTPSNLTEDNKQMVSHLKSRKRKLFADTLKEVRQMGFRSNHSTDVLGRQASLSAVLSTIPALQNDEHNGVITSADYYLHNFLNLMPAVRSATKDLSEEITSTEVVRSIGYIEGLLSRLMKQRDTLAGLSPKTVVLTRTAESFQNLWQPQDYSLNANGRDTMGPMQSLHKTIVWLPSILGLGCNIIQAQGRLGKMDSSAVEHGLQMFRRSFVDHIAAWEMLPVVPDGLSTSNHTEWHDKVVLSLQQLDVDLERWTHEQPLMAFVFKQISLWTDVSQPLANGHLNGTRAVTMSSLVLSLSRTLDTILVSLQHMQNPANSMPSSTEDAGWLIKSDSCLVATFKALNPDMIVSKLEESMLQLQDLDSSKLLVGAALFRMILPMVQQYKTILSDVLRRYAMLHQSTCHLSYVLAKSFVQISSQGFCTPAEESKAQDSKTERLEDGTGLGEGEGAEDISKDIQDDEDLSELAQQADAKEDEAELEDEKDAVDMNQDDLEGQMGDVSEKGEDDEGEAGDKESSDEMDEEAGGVDDLDASAVDEKLWDDDGDEAKRDKEGDQSNGKRQEKEMTSAEEEKQDTALEGEEREGDEIENENEGSEEGEQVSREELDKTDPHLQEEQKLDLPEEMDLDHDNGSEAMTDSDDERMNEMSDIDESVTGGEQPDIDTEDNEAKTSDEHEVGQDEMSDVDNLDEKPADVDENQADMDSPVDTEGEEDSSDEHEGVMSSRADQAAVDKDNVVPSDVQGLGNENGEEAGNEEEKSHLAQQDQGSKGDTSPTKQLEAAADEGQASGNDQESGFGRANPEEVHESQESSGFKKLGDALERWHRQQRQIREASGVEERRETKPQDTDATEPDFEHLPSEGAHADAQALGAATEDQAQALDESKVVDSEDKQLPSEILAQANEDEPQDLDMSNFEMQAPLETRQVEQPSNATMEGQKGKSNDRNYEDDTRQMQDDQDLDDVDEHLSTVHLGSTTLNAARSPEQARQLWSHYENQTRELSLSLTEQLRLILAPTLATKMRGDFRTGKRLNIKRIIPYIASQYKRDKIWMRRSVPSKRNYQIMVAVDDSKSMGESGSGQLAFETLALVSKSLSMLEVGEICIVGFGDDVRVAHEFDKPFSSEAGVHVFQQFGFQQTKTDVRKLVAESIDLFRDARNKTFGAGADLWQLELIISDGICEDHDTIRRLVRQAQEERIMIVFVIVDALRGSSIMDMSQATFEPDEVGQMKLKMRRYLDDFPFGYYLVVGDVRELPGVLATALRQWFAEVVDAAG